MERKEKGWRIAEIVIGAIGALLLVTILILRLLKYDVLFMTYPLVGIVVLFLLADERARMLKRKRIKAEEKDDPNAKPAEPEETLPKEAFEFDEKQP